MTDTLTTPDAGAQLSDHAGAQLARRGGVTWLRRQRVQLTGAVLLAVVIPFVVRIELLDAVQAWDQARTSLLVLLAVILSHAMTRQLASYPGEDPLSSVLPAVAVGFAATLLLVAVTHLQYSRSLFLVGFVITFAWYAALRIVLRRTCRPHYALAVAGDAGDLAREGGATWVSLPAPVSAAALRGTDGVVVDLTHSLPMEWSDFVVSCAAAGLPVYDSSRTRELMTGRVALSRAGGIGVDAVMRRRTYIAIKGAVDVVAALAALPFALVILAVAAVAIKLDSRGPVFFLQKRVGYRGAVFLCYKLRSMQVHAPESGPSFTTAGDARITRVGRVIRKYRIDELPQIFNILRGEMSWIGPRPEALALATEYERHIPYYAFRHAVKPGISGWGAIHQGNVAEVEEATLKLSYDFFYIKHISASLDAFIVVKTVWTVLTGFGSK